MNGYLADVCRVLYMKGYEAFDIHSILSLNYGIYIPIRSIRAALSLDTFSDRELPSGYLLYLANPNREYNLLLPFTEDILDFITELYTPLRSETPFSCLYSREEYSLSPPEPVFATPAPCANSLLESKEGHRDWYGGEFTFWYPRNGRSGLQNYLVHEKSSNRRYESLPEWSNDGD